MSVINRQEVSQVLAELTGEGRGDLSRLQGGTDDVNGRIDDIEAEYKSTWKYFKELGVFTDYLTNWVTERVSVRGGVFKAVYDALDAGVKVVRDYVDEKVKWLKGYVEQERDVAIRRAESMDATLSEAVKDQGDDFTKRLEKLAGDLRKASENAEGIERRVLERYARDAETMRTDIVNWKTDVDRRLVEIVRPLEEKVAELNDDLGYLVGEIKGLRTRFGAPLRGRRQTVEETEDTQIEAPAVETAPETPTQTDTNVEPPVEGGDQGAGPSQPDANPSGTP